MGTLGDMRNYDLEEKQFGLITIAVRGGLGVSRRGERIRDHVERDDPWRNPFGRTNLRDVCGGGHASNVLELRESPLEECTEQ
jgi:hypothetical protein